MPEKSGKVQYTKSRMLGYFLKGSVILFALTVAANIVVTFLNTLIPQVIGFTIDSVLGDVPVTGVFITFTELFGGIARIKDDIWITALVILMIAALTLIFRYLGVYLNARANQTFMRRMRNCLFSHIQRLPMSWHKAHSTGDIIQRCTSDADTISNFVSNQLVGLVRIVMLLVMSLVFMFLTDVRLAAIASVFLPMLVGYSLFFYFRAHKGFKKCDEQEGVLSAYAQENLTGVRVVKAFGRERYERDRFEKQNTYYTGLWVRLEKFLALYWSSSDFIAALQLMFIVVFGTVFCVNGDLTAGKLVEFISYNTMMIGPVRQLGRIISGLNKANVSLGRIAEIMNADEENYGETEKLSGDIVFDGVRFGYESDKPILTNIDLRIKEGTTLGIIGSTGCGKTTLARLMDGLYAPTAGSIKIGDTDIRDLSPSTLRRNIGFVTQEGYIYSRTIADNITMASSGTTESEMRGAAKLACLHDNISNFSDGYDTTVGERGVTLSGGQKQRLAIARTVIRNTPYIILDDSLSAVDSETDALIRQNLETRLEGVTTVIISHRISTVMNADNIIVLDGGRIAESGTHEELLSKNGIYKRIYDLQTPLAGEAENGGGNG